MDEVTQLATDLERLGRVASIRTRGIMAEHLDTAAANAQRDALSSWTKYGQGMRGSAGTIRARMSRSVGSRGGGRQLGYLLADGDGVFQAEHGTHDRAPDPVMGQAVEAIADPVAQAMLALADL
jgi:hypothetical protein